MIDVIKIRVAIGEGIGKKGKLIASRNKGITRRNLNFKKWWSEQALAHSVSTKFTPEEVSVTSLKTAEAFSSLPRRLSHSPFVRLKPRRSPGLLLAEDYGKRLRALTFLRRRNAET